MKSLKNKKILIIGGSGFIGSAVSSILRKNNFITILDQKKPKIDNVKFIKGNFFNSTKIDRLIKNNQIIIIFLKLNN